MKRKQIDLIAVLCTNMLAQSCFKVNAGLGRLKDKLENLTQRKWMLTGSGSAMYCLFGQKQKEAVRKFQKQIEGKTGYRCIIVTNNKW